MHTLNDSLTRVARLYRTRTAALLRELELHPGQDAILKLLAEGTYTMGGLAAIHGVTAPTITKMVDRMARAGLVHTSYDKGDRRKVWAALTQEGHARAALLDQVMQRLDEETFGALSITDRERLAALLDQIRDGLEPAEEEMEAA